MPSVSACFPVSRRGDKLPSQFLTRTLRIISALTVWGHRNASSSPTVAPLGDGWSHRAALASMSHHVISNLVDKIRTMARVSSSIPPRMRSKKHSLTLSSSSQAARKEPVISTTLRCIIQRGEVMEHVSGLDELLLCVWQHCDTVLLLLEACAAHCVENAREVIASNIMGSPQLPVQAVRQRSSHVSFQTTPVSTGPPVQGARPPPFESGSSDKRTQKVIPSDGRLSVRTGRRLVGSTIARRFLNFKGCGTGGGAAVADRTLSAQIDPPNASPPVANSSRAMEGIPLGRSSGYYNVLPLLPFRVLCVTIEQKLLVEFVSSIPVDDLRRSYFEEGESNVYVSIAWLRIVYFLWCN